MTSQQNSGGLEFLDDDWLPTEPVDDATALAWLDQVVRRLRICLVALAVAFLIAILPVPFATDAASLTRVALELYAPPDPGYLRPGTGFWLYFQFAALIAMVFAQPVLVYQALAMLAPPRHCPSRARRVRATGVAILALVVGLVVGHALVLPMVMQAEAYLWERGVVTTFYGRTLLRGGSVLASGLLCEVVALIVTLHVFGRPRTQKGAGAKVGTGPS